MALLALPTANLRHAVEFLLTVSPSRRFQIPPLISGGMLNPSDSQHSAADSQHSAACAVAILIYHRRELSAVSRRFRDLMTEMHLEVPESTPPKWFARLFGLKPPNGARRSGPSVSPGVRLERAAVLQLNQHAKVVLRYNLLVMIGSRFHKEHADVRRKRGWLVKHAVRFPTQGYKWDCRYNDPEWFRSQYNDPEVRTSRKCSVYDAGRMAPTARDGYSTLVDHAMGQVLESLRGCSWHLHAYGVEISSHSGDEPNDDEAFGKVEEFCRDRLLGDQHALPWETAL